MTHELGKVLNEAGILGIGAAVAVVTIALLLAMLLRQIRGMKTSETLLARHGLDFRVESGVAGLVQASQPEVGEQLLEVAFRHPIKLVANALGIAPRSMIDRAKAAGVPVAALVGSKEHADRKSVV